MTHRYPQRCFSKSLRYFSNHSNGTIKMNHQNSHISQTLIAMTKYQENNLRGKRFILAHSFRGLNLSQCTERGAFPHSLPLCTYHTLYFFHQAAKFWLVVTLQFSQKTSIFRMGGTKLMHHCFTCSTAMYIEQMQPPCGIWMEFISPEFLV
jgi:hypothetical protein